MARVESLTEDGILALFAAKTAEDATLWGTIDDVAENTANIAAQGLVIATHTSQIASHLANITSAQADIVTNQAYSVASRPVICTSTTRPTTNMFVGKRIYETDTKAFGQWDGANWVVLDSVWQSYTSGITAASGGFSLGNSVMTAKYMRYAKLCAYQISVIIGNSGYSAGSGYMQVVLPFASGATPQDMPVGTCVRQIAGARTVGHSTINGPGATFFINWDSYSANSLITGGGAGNNDKFFFSGFYETA